MKHAMVRRKHLEADNHINPGGNCRIRSSTPLKGEGTAALDQASAENRPPFYSCPREFIT